MPENSSNTFSPTLEPPLELCTHEPSSSEPAGPSIPSPAPLPVPQANHSQGCQTLVQDRAGVKKLLFQSHLGTQIIHKIQGFVCGLGTELMHVWKSQAGVRIMGDNPDV